MDTGGGWFSYLLTSAAPLFHRCHHHRPCSPPFASSYAMTASLSPFVRGAPRSRPPSFAVCIPLGPSRGPRRFISLIYFPFSAFSLARSLLHPVPATTVTIGAAAVPSTTRHHRHPRQPRHRRPGLLVTFPVHAVLPESFAQCSRLEERSRGAPAARRPRGCHRSMAPFGRPCCQFLANAGPHCFRRKATGDLVEFSSIFSYSLVHDIFGVIFFDFLQLQVPRLTGSCGSLNFRTLDFFC